MRTTIDKAGRVVIPAAVRQRAGLIAGSELEITEEERGIRLERVAAGPRLVKVGRRLVARPSIAAHAAAFRGYRGRRSRKNETAGRERLSRYQRAARRIDRLRAAKRAGAVAHARGRRGARRQAGHRVALLPRVLFGRDAAAARVPARTSATRFTWCRRRYSPGSTSTTCRPGSLADSPRGGARRLSRGGRIYDAHIAEMAREAGAAVVVTDNRRHFLSALRYGMRVETPTEFLAPPKSRT